MVKTQYLNILDTISAKLLVIKNEDFHFTFERTLGSRKLTIMEICFDQFMSINGYQWVHRRINGFYTYYSLQALMNKVDTFSFFDIFSMYHHMQACSIQ